MMMYQEMGFEDKGVDMDVEAKRTDGELRKDKRVFLYCVLSQIDVDGHFEDDST